MHTHNLFDSALTGAILGGAYRSFTSTSYPMVYPFKLLALMQSTLRWTS